MKRFGTVLVSIVALGLLAVSPAFANTSWTGKAPANTSWTGKAPANTTWTGKAPANASWTGKRPANSTWGVRGSRSAPLGWSDGS